MTSVEHIEDEHDWVISHLTDCLSHHADAAVTERVNRHLAGCKDCSAELAIERRVREYIRRPATVEYTPGASFAKLRSRLAENQAPELAAPRRQNLRRLAVPLSLAASLAALAISLVSLVQVRTPAGEAPFQTLSRIPQLPGELHVGFSDAAGAAEIERALSPVNGRIVSGPSAAGVYRIAIGEGFSVQQAIGILVRQPAVRVVTALPGAGDE